MLQSAVNNIFTWDGEVTGSWIKLLNNDIHNLKFLPFFIIMGIKSWKMIWVRHAARSGQMRNLLSMLHEIPEGIGWPQYVKDKGRNEPNER